MVEGLVSHTTNLHIRYLFICFCTTVESYDCLLPLVSPVATFTALNCKPVLMSTLSVDLSVNISVCVLYGLERVFIR